MKSTHLRILTIGAAVLLVAAAAIAEGRHGYGGPGRLSPHAQAARSDQRATGPGQVDLGKREARPAALDAAMRQNHSAMNALEASGPFDEAKTRALATQNSQTMIELQVEHARIKSEIMQILTADQKAKLAQLEANRAARMSKHTPPPPAD